MPLINLSGMVALPDTPLMFFSSLFFWFLPRYLARDSWKNALYLGLIISLMFYSKYHGLLIVLLTSFANPAFFKRKTFWGIIGVVTILFLPHVYWQYQHDFISFKFHLFQRVEKHFSLNNILDFIGGQIVLMGFLNFFLFCYIFYKNKFKDPYERILIFNSFGFLFFLFFMSFRNQIEANWTISCSIAFIILMVKYLAPYKKILIGFSIINIFLHVGLKVILFNLGPVINLMDQQENRLNEIWGWKEERIGKINQLCGSLDIVGDNYQVTSKMAFYNRNPKISALHLGSRESQYSILKLQKMIKANKKICYLTSKNLSGSARVETNYKDPVFVLQTTLGDLATRYGITYAEIIRSRN
ncbi:MAG: hypothetical protein HON90_03930 [Halobacteriovoraceae bacterium]|nr:hypothetical protein [Halobacteriovoraceae bacterium]